MENWFEKLGTRGYLDKLINSQGNIRHNCHVTRVSSHLWVDENGAITAEKNSLNNTTTDLVSVMGEIGTHPKCGCLRLDFPKIYRRGGGCVYLWNVGIFCLSVRGCLNLGVAYFWMQGKQFWKFFFGTLLNPWVERLSGSPPPEPSQST